MLATIDKAMEFGSVAELCYEHVDDRLEARVNNLRLSSEFQAIYSLSHRKPIGYEGLLRVRDAQHKRINPAHYFSNITEQGEKVRIDRLSRYLHTQNFQRAGADNAWLFLNIHPDVILNGLQYGAFFSECLEAAGTPARNVVVEILEHSINDRGLLNDAVQYYRDLGCKIAIDDFGALASNIDRLWSIEPDIVKLDRSLAVELEKPSVRRLLPSLVSMIHECGSLVLMEGVETEDQALMAIDSGVDFVQGYCFARPCKDLECEAPAQCIGEGGSHLSNLCNQYYNYVFERQRRHDEAMGKYMLPFELAAREHAFAGSPAEFAGILSLSGVERCYILDEKGFQIGETFYPDGHEEMFPSRFGHVSDGEGSTWFRRHYFRRSLQEPDKVHHSRPYLSMTGGILCKTLSLCLTTTDGDVRVYCCDIDWSDF